MIGDVACTSLRYTTMFTYSHANTPLGQSERVYYLSYFINIHIYPFSVFISFLTLLSSSQVWLVTKTTHFKYLTLKISVKCFEKYTLNALHGNITNRTFEVRENEKRNVLFTIWNVINYCQSIERTLFMMLTDWMEDASIAISENAKAKIHIWMKRNRSQHVWNLRVLWFCLF